VKHTWKITAVLLIMFVVTQLIGLAVINAYIPVKNEQNITINPLPYNMQPPEIKTQKEYFSMIPAIIFAFVIAILLILFLTKIRAALFLRLWFFIVVILAISITLNSLFLKFDLSYATLIAALIALPLAFFKIFRRNLLVHNITELMIYPGIAAVFVPILNVWTIIVLLIAISIYDIYAVWHSKFMQNMAKFQINELKFFAGFFVPYTSKKEREKIKYLKQKYKKKQIPEKVLKSKKIKMSLAILGGGDVIFPIIAAGIFLKFFGLLPALIVTAGAVVALAALFVVARKGRFYPAMPFLTAGIFVGMILGWLASLLI